MNRHVIFSALKQYRLVTNPDKVIFKTVLIIKKCASLFSILSIHPWSLAAPVIYLGIPGVPTRTHAPPTMLQHFAVSTISDLHSSSAHIYTEGSL